MSEGEVTVLSLRNDRPVFFELRVTKVPLGNNLDGLSSFHLEGVELAGSLAQFTDILITLSVD